MYRLYFIVFINFLFGNYLYAQENHPLCREKVSLALNRSPLYNFEAYKNNIGINPKIGFETFTSKNFILFATFDYYYHKYELYNEVKTSKGLSSHVDVKYHGMTAGIFYKLYMDNKNKIKLGGSVSSSHASIKTRRIVELDSNTLIEYSFFANYVRFITLGVYFDRRINDKYELGFNFSGNCRFDRLTNDGQNIVPILTFGMSIGKCNIGF